MKKRLDQAALEPRQYQLALERVATKNYTSPEDAGEDLVLLTTGVWYRGFTPDLTSFHGFALRKAAYVVDWLASGWVLEDNRRADLKELLHRAKQRLEMPRQNPPKINNDFDDEPLHTFYLNDRPSKRDQLATRWGLANGMRPSKVPKLLDLQRRVVVYRFQSESASKASR